MSSYFTQNSSTPFEPELNQICILKWTENQVCRVQFLGDNWVRFVDYGNEYEMESEAILIPISKKSLEILPFQAIKCSLAHVKPFEGKNKFRFVFR